jgi:hypothetical protein
VKKHPQEGEREGEKRKGGRERVWEGEREGEKELEEEEGRDMGMMMLLVTATKVVGVMGALTVAANSFAYRRFHKKNLAPFENPVDESHELLASFPIHKDGWFSFLFVSSIRLVLFLFWFSERGEHLGQKLPLVLNMMD